MSEYKKNCQAIGVTVMALFLASASQGAIKYVDDIQGLYSTTSQVWWFNGTNDTVYLAPNLSSIISGLKTAGSSTYDYTISGKFLMTCPLVNDISHNGYAIGDFGGSGVTFTFNGKVKTSTGQYVLGSASTSVDVFTGTFDLDQGTTWRMTEMDNISHWFLGTVFFDVNTSVGLGAGAAIPGTSDIMKIGDFSASLSFQQCNDATSFLTSTGLYSPGGGAGKSVQIKAVPEPVSVLFLSVGSFLIGCRRRKQERQN